MIVKDNIIKEEDANYIESFFTNFTFPYYLNPIVYPQDTEDYQMTHIFFDDYKVTSDFFNILNPILDYLKPKALVRIKTNLIYKSEKLNIHGYHIDYNYKNLKTAVYYVNTNDGFTIFQKDNKKVNSKKNRIVIFDSDNKHSGTNCTDKPFRIAINFNYYE
tara:strand:- start:883 stop:1365 length:483 start_codon:yes stop_codon:yes gene_type:complete